jgi:CheY-like chemotaxis protein
VLDLPDIELIRAKNGKEAVEIAKSNKDIDIILMDIKMPEKDGYTATSEIKKFRPNLPIIAQTAYAMEGDEEKAFQAGCDDYIAKPISPDKLILVINQYI